MLALTRARNSEATETEVEYDLEVEVSSNASEQHSCPILSHRVHPTKQRSICCRSEKFHLISEKWTKCCRFDRFVRFVKWKSLLSIRQVRSSIGQLHLISDDGDPVKVLSNRSIRSICQMEKFPIDSTSAVVDRTIASH